MIVVVVLAAANGLLCVGLIVSRRVGTHVAGANGPAFELVHIWSDRANGSWSSVSSCGFVFLAWK